MPPFKECKEKKSFSQDIATFSCPISVDSKTGLYLPRSICRFNLQRRQRGLGCYNDLYKADLCGGQALDMHRLIFAVWQSFNRKSATDNFN